MTGLLETDGGGDSLDSDVKGELGHGGYEDAHTESSTSNQAGLSVRTNAV